MKKSLISYTTSALLLTASLTMVGCGSDDNDSSSTTPTQPTPATSYNGKLVDSAVSNVAWSCGDNNGVTTATGAFGVCTEKVTFKLGNITLGSMMPAADFDMIFTPRDLAGVSRSGSGDTDSVALANKIASLLISMDSDGNPDNGITITDDAVKALEDTHSADSDISTLNQTEVDTIIKGTIDTITTKDPAAGNAMDQKTAKEAEDHQTDTAKKIEDEEIAPPAQVDPTASLKWEDNSAIYAMEDDSKDSEDGEHEEDINIGGRYPLDFTTMRGYDKPEVYNQTTKSWEDYDWNDYVLENGKWVKDNDNPFTVSEDGLILHQTMGDYKILAIASLDGIKKKFSDLYGGLFVTFSDGDTQNKFSEKAKETFFLWDLEKNYDYVTHDYVTYDNIATFMHKHGTMEWYYDEEKGRHFSIAFERDLTNVACGDYSKYLEASINGLDGDLNADETGTLVLYDQSTCTQTPVGIWRGQALSDGNVGLIGEPTAGNEKYFEDVEDNEYPFFALNSSLSPSLVWDGEYRKAKDEFTTGTEFEVNKSAYEKMKTVVATVPSVENGFQQAYLDGRTLYVVVLDKEDDDKDGNTTEYIIVGMKHENGVRTLDFNAEGKHVITEKYTLSDTGVMTITEQDGDTDTMTIEHVYSEDHIGTIDSDHDADKVYYTLEDAKEALDWINSHP